MRLNGILGMFAFDVVEDCDEEGATGGGATTLFEAAGTEDRILSVGGGVDVGGACEIDFPAIRSEDIMCFFFSYRNRGI